MVGFVTKIVPAEMEDGDKFLRAYGTRLFCGEHYVTGVVRMTVHFEHDDVVRADAELLVKTEEIDGAETTFYVAHPETGKRVDITELLRRTRY